MSAMRVYSLIGKQSFDYCILCLRSFLRQSQDPVDLHLLSDGSLDAEQVERTEALGGTTVRFRGEFAGLVADRLAGRPALAEYRANCVMGFKLVDLPIMAGLVPFRYIDSVYISFGHSETCLIGIVLSVF